MIKKITAAIVALIAFSGVATAQTDADAIVGIWQNGEGTGHVKIEKIGSKYYGKIVWLKEPNDPATGKPKTDKKNPNEKMRNTPVLGYRILRDFVYEADKKWKDGMIYDPKKGEDYKCSITMVNKNTIEVRGYIGVSLIGRTDTWKRVSKPGGTVLK